MMRPWMLRHTLIAGLACAGLLLLAWIFGMPGVDERTRAPALAPVDFADIEGWAGDDHAQAFAAFWRSCEKIVNVHAAREQAGTAGHEPHPLLEVCRAALALDPASASAARAFFEDHFTPHRYSADVPAGLVTGYYEPELKGARVRSDRYHVPVYRVPEDLVQLFPDSERARRNEEMTAGRETDEGVVPYYDRKEIEEGALEGRGLELLWLEDPVDAFYMHIQGSGRVGLEEGGHARIAYAAKNGHPYTAIGKLLIERGAIAPKNMSMEAVRGWLAENPEEARTLMWANRSYIFFRELPDDPGVTGPEGAQGVPLTPRRSLAVDTSIHAAGTPVWVDAPKLDVHGEKGFHRLMVAQDTGSAIRGHQRGDIFWGTGLEAGAIAGATRHAARFTILLPKGVKLGSP